MARWNFLVPFLLLTATPAAIAAESRVMLHNPRGEVVSTYAAITSLPAPQARSMFRTLTVAMQGDVWLLHLDEFMVNHPELTAEQRAVIYEGIGLLASGAIEPRGLDGSATPAVQYAVGVFGERAKSVHGPQLAFLAFANLSREHSAIGLPPTATARPRTNAPLLPGQDECQCSGDSDWCGDEEICKVGDCIPTWSAARLVED